MLLTDAPAAPSITSVLVSIDQVSAHSSATGWQVVSTTPRTFDLLKLKNVTAELALASLPAGVYTQLRLSVVSASIVVDGATEPLRVPSGSQSGLKLIARFVVAAGRRTVLTLDFDAEKSVHFAKGEGWMLRPTIKVVGASALDFDGDGVPDAADNCPATPNPTQADGDGDQLGDACDACPGGADSDLDGICDSVDNCPSVENPDQSNVDGDGLGDLCDTQRPLAALTPNEQVECFDVAVLSFRDTLKADRFTMLNVSPVLAGAGPSAPRQCWIEIFDYPKSTYLDAKIDLLTGGVLQARSFIGVHAPLGRSEEEPARAIAETGALASRLAANPGFQHEPLILGTDGVCGVHRCVELRYSTLGPEQGPLPAPWPPGSTFNSRPVVPLAKAIVDLTAQVVVSTELF